MSAPSDPSAAVAAPWGDDPASSTPPIAVATQACLACREDCGACCTAPSITSPLPGMPQGKPAGVPCVQLDARMRCRVFGRPERPAFCARLRPSPDMCGGSRADALELLGDLERQTAP